MDGVVIAAATDAHPRAPHRRGRCRAAGVLREAGGRGRWPRASRSPAGSPTRACPSRSATRAASTPGSPPPGGDRRAASSGWLHTVRSTTLDPAPPPPAYIAVSGGIFRDCSVHDFDAVRWVTGRRSSRSTPPGRTGVTRSSPSAATSPPPQPCSPSTTAPSPWCRTPATTPVVTTCGMELHGSDDSIAAGLDDKLPLRSVEPGSPSPAGQPYVFFMDRFADAFRAELAAFTEVAAGNRRLTVHDRRRSGDELGGRGGHAVAGRAPPVASTRCASSTSAAGAAAVDDLMADVLDDGRRRRLGPARPAQPVTAPGAGRGGRRRRVPRFRAALGRSSRRPSRSTGCRDPVPARRQRHRGSRARGHPVLVGRRSATGGVRPDPPWPAQGRRGAGRAAHQGDPRRRRRAVGPRPLGGEVRRARRAGRRRRHPAGHRVLPLVEHQDVARRPAARRGRRARRRRASSSTPGTSSVPTPRSRISRPSRCAGSSASSSTTPTRKSSGRCSRTRCIDAGTAERARSTCRA